MSEPDSDDPFAPVAPRESPAGTRQQATTPPARKTAAPLDEALRIGPDGCLPVRSWTDNSGMFKVEARLILILDGKVRLLKQTGRTTTVPLDRLSAADREYVEAVIARYGKDLSRLDQLAAR